MKRTKKGYGRRMWEIMRGKRAVAEVMEEMWPKPGHCPASPRKIREWRIQRCYFDEEVFETLLWNTDDICKESFSPFQVNKVEPSGNQSVEADVRGSKWQYHSYCHLCFMERQKQQREHTGDPVTLGCSERTEGGIWGLETRPATQFAGLSAAWKCKAPC